MKLAPKSVLKICKLSVLALAIAVKNPKIVSETHTKWSQIGAISESWGLPFKTHGTFRLRSGPAGVSIRIPS